MSWKNIYNFFFLLLDRLVTEDNEFCFSNYQINLFRKVLNNLPDKMKQLWWWTQQHHGSWGKDWTCCVKSSPRRTFILVIISLLNFVKDSGFEQMGWGTCLWAHFYFFPKARSTSALTLLKAKILNVST